MERTREGPSTHIALDIERDRNRELLAKLLGEYEVVDYSGAVPEETDLCLIDEAALRRSDDGVRAWKTAQSPVFAPVVLLSEADTSDPWDEFEEPIRTYVDTVLQIPIPKAELSARIENLLQMRDLSRDLDEERQLTDLVFEASPLAKLVVAPDRTIVRANERTGAVFDMEPAELVGKEYDSGDWTAIREDGTEIPVAERPFTRLLETGEAVYDHEQIIRRPDHDDMWVSMNMAPIRDRTGDIVYVVVVVEDITVRHTQAEKLEQQVDLFQRAQNIANVGAWEYDVRTEELYCTEEIYNIYGLSHAVDLTAELLLEMSHPAERAIIEDAFRRAIESGDSYDVEIRVVTRSGETKWIQTRGEPQFSGGDVVQTRGTIQDITERKEREAELGRMKNAVDKAPIGTVLSDPQKEDNPLVYVNERFVEQTGYTREEALGRNCRFLQGEGTSEETIATLRRKINAEEPVSVTIRNYRADGSAFWNRLDVAPVRNDEGTVVNYIGFQQDVTDLMEQRRQLEILDRYLRHNVRNKMNVIDGFAELIRQEGSPSVSEYGETIARTSSILLQNMEKERSITKLLHADSEPEAVEVMSAIRPIVQEASERHPDATVSLSGPNTARGRAVPELPIAVAELIRNAVMHNDGESPTVEVTVELDADTVSVSVADDGPGIPAVEIDVLTDADTETAVRHGQGMGIWLVYLIVTRSGGRLEFAERDSGGSVVTIELARQDESA